MKITLIAMAWHVCAASTFAGQATYGRIDIYVADKGFDLGDLGGSPGARVGNCSWLGKGKEDAGASCQVRLNPYGKWQELWVEFVPRGDGPVDIDLQGEYYKRTSKEDVRLVWADNVSVEGEGVEIGNAGFEEATPDGKPVGWRFTGAFGAEQYSRDGKVAKFGKSCVAVWYGSQARQAFRVQRGKRYRVRAWFRLLEVDPEQVALAERVSALRPRFEHYTQKFEIVFRDDDAARKARLRVLPLFNGHEWAISSRWDDNNSADLKMRQVLEAHGYRGNFYLNGTGRWNPEGMDKKLLAGGNTIGGHSWTHPMLSYCNRNRIFEEVMRVRADRESSSDSPLCSYAFSFCNFTNAMLGTHVHADVAEVLFRAGFHHVANGRFARGLGIDMPVSWLLPADGKPIDTAFAALLRNQDIKRTSPNISFDMHVWYRTPEAWRKFEAQLDKYGRNPRWWYCNQNEYGAYRHQFACAKIDTQQEGKRLRVTLTRPCLLDLNDEIPLTFSIDGVARAAVTEIVSADAKVERVDAAGATFHLWHSSGQRLPTKVGWIRNAENRQSVTDQDSDPDYPQVLGLLCREQGRLRLRLRNRDEVPLTNVRVTYRLPLAWEGGVVVRGKLKVAPGGEYANTLDLTQAQTGHKYHSGVSFYAAQVDFEHAGAAGRLYLTCRVPKTDVDPSYPQSRFQRIGPVPAAELDMNTVAALARDGGGASWKPPDSKHRELLDVEIIQTSGQWRLRGKSDEYYLLRTSLHSDATQKVRVRADRSTTTAIFHNGKKLDGDLTKLAQGPNRLLLVCRCTSSFRGSNAGAFLRITSPESTRRLTNLRFMPE